MPGEAAAIGLEPGWLSHLEPEFQQPYMKQLKCFLIAEKAAGKRIYPHSSLWFNAYRATPLDAVKVVILGQDPYHGAGQAHGLCFSVLPGVALPPSLVNIYKEIESETGLPLPTHGCLTGWADQGVLLLNSVLTVEHAQAASHQQRGWETFTDRTIEIVNQRCEGVVFLLWGAYAQRKGSMIDTTRHLVLKAPHPSPLSSYRGFFGCGHFLQTNAYLEQRGLAPIDWHALPESNSQRLEYS